MLDSYGRRLIWVPVLHTQADLGTMSDSVRRIYARGIGRGQWERHLRVIDEMWRGIRKQIAGLNLDYTKVRLYQDGLPDCARAGEIVRDLEQRGSQNHRLLLELMEKGAALTGTESPELLVQEYQLARKILSSLASRKASPTAESLRELSGSMLDKRDSYIAQRIDKTLSAGETGLIFLGMLHSLQGRLPADVQLIRLSCLTAHTENTDRAAQRRPGR